MNPKNNKNIESETMYVSKRLKEEIMNEPCVRKFYKALLDEMEENEDFELSDRTMSDYCYQLHLLFKDLRKNPDDTVTIEECRQWKKDRLAKGIGRKTMSVKVAAVNHYLRLCCGYQGKGLKVKNITRKKKPTVLTYEQVMSMVQYNKAQEKYISAMMIYFTFKCGGPRKDNVHRVRLSDLALESTQKSVRFTRMKGDREHIVPLSDEDAAEIQNYIDNHRPTPAPGHEDYLFLMSNGKKVNPQKLEYTLKRTSVALNIRESVHPHTLRTSYIMWRRRQGWRPEEIAVFTGHKSVKTLYESYIMEESRQHAYERINEDRPAPTPAPKPTPTPIPQPEIPDIDKQIRLLELQVRYEELQQGRRPEPETLPHKNDIGHQIRDVL